MKYKKITYGFVIQNYDKDNKCVSQEFVAGDQVEFEDARGNPIEGGDEEYQDFEMVQPTPE